MPSINLMTFGDSWLTDTKLKYGSRAPVMLTTRLNEMGFSCTNEFADTGRTLANMTLEKLTEFNSQLHTRIGHELQPKAILLGGGGNDLTLPTKVPTSTKLYQLIDKDGPSFKLNLTEAKAFFALLSSHWIKIIGEVIKTQDEATAKIPIVTHGYDFPIPDGRKYEGIVGHLGQRGPWLKPVFDSKNDTISLESCAQLMRELIEGLNDMMETVAKSFPDNRVHHVRLCGTLEVQTEYSFGGGATGYQLFWANELHPTERGFRILADKLKEKLTAIGVT